MLSPSCTVMSQRDSPLYPNCLWDSLCTPTAYLEFSNRIKGYKRRGSFPSHPLLLQHLCAVCPNPCQGYHFDICALILLCMSPHATISVYVSLYYYSISVSLDYYAGLLRTSSLILCFCYIRLLTRTLDYRSTSDSHY